MWTKNTIEACFKLFPKKNFMVHNIKEGKSGSV